MYYYHLIVPYYKYKTRYSHRIRSDQDVKIYPFVKNLFKIKDKILIHKMLNKLFIKLIKLILPFLVTTKRKCKKKIRNEYM